MRWATLVSAGALGLALGGCVRRSSSEWPQTMPINNPPNPTSTTVKSNSAPVIVTPSQGIAGRITSVNAASRYVVISYPIGIPLPQVEQRLNVYRAGLKVAEIKITGPSRDTNTIGDIVAGDCQIGDQVRID